MERKGAGGTTADTAVKIEIVKMFLIRTSRILIFSLKVFLNFFFFKALTLCFKSTGNQSFNSCTEE